MFVTVFGKEIYYEMYGTEEENTLLYLHGGLEQAVWILSIRQKY